MLFLLTPRCFALSLLRLEFDHSHLDYYTEIDAVSVAGLPEMSVSDQMNSDGYEKLEIVNISGDVSILSMLVS